MAVPEGLALPNDISQVYYNDIPIGTMCCRVEVKDEEAKLYLMTLAVLAVSLSRIAISPTHFPNPTLGSHIAQEALDLKASNISSTPLPHT